ncbi:MAG: CRISPR-associated protein Cas4 [Thermoprotei archaeon]|jgi:CRISPR-associated exonuclease Cas4
MIIKYISPTDVKEYAFCPRLVYYKNVLHIYERMTEAMELGKEIHKEEPITHLIPLFKVMKILKDVELTSKQLKLTGKIDYILVTKFNEYIPVDMKYADLHHQNAQKHHKMQLVAYSLLIEEAYKTTVKRAVIYYGRARKTITILITDALKKQTKEIIKNIYQMLETNKEPVVLYEPKCKSCNYLKYCKPI